MAKKKKLPEFEIRITGSGTRYELARRLQTIADNLKATYVYSDKNLDGAEWEDPTLMTEIFKIEEE